MREYLTNAWLILFILMAGDSMHLACAESKMGAKFNNDGKLGDSKAAVSNFNNAGVLKYNKGNYKGAIVDCTEAIDIDPKCSSCFHNRGLAKQKSGDKSGAQKDFQQDRTKYGAH
jgi:lipoprotein NlpI